MKDEQGWLGFRQDVEGKRGEVPAFVFAAWTGGVVGRLSQPQRAFGLCLGGPVTGAALKELAGLKGLQMLSLDHTQVTDAGMKELAQLKGLQWLSLNGTRVTDAGLKELAELGGLQMLYLIQAMVTDAGVAELQKALPELTIWR